LLANGCWRRRPSSMAGGSGGSVAPESRSCLEHADQGVRASPAPDAPTSVQYQRRASAESVKRRGVARAAPQRPRETQHGPGPTTWPARVAQRTRAARAPLNRPAPAVVAAHRFDHSLTTNRSRVSAARSPLDHLPFGGTVAAWGTTEYQAATPRRWRACGSHPRHSDGPACGTPDAHPVRQPPEPLCTRATTPTASPCRSTVAPAARPAPGRWKPTVRVAAPAGPAPPPATCAPPEARRASA
jgi:hypothetical protein